VGTDLPGLDFVALAAGHGLPAGRVEDAGALHQALREAIQADGPVLLEVVTA
jgi:benzoylformate decarboxylase